MSSGKGLILAASIALPALLLQGSASSQTVDSSQVGSACRPAFYSTRAQNALPLRELPEHVYRRPGALSIYADFNSSGFGYVPVFLINATEDISIPTQDRSVFLKLMVQESDKTWVRAQRHGFSWCGNSYYDMTLPARSYFEFRGYTSVAPNAAKRTVRYELYSPYLVSNVGTAPVDPKEVEASPFDAIYLRFAGLDELRRIALGHQDRPRKPSPRIRVQALMQLSRFYRTDHDRVIGTWKVLARNDEDPMVKEAAKKILDRIEERETEP